MTPSSWVICDKSTGRAIAETWLQSVVAAINTNKYEAVPIRQHLEKLNHELRENQ